jgi:hypothetical protein
MVYPGKSTSTTDPDNERVTVSSSKSVVSSRQTREGIREGKSLDSKVMKTGEEVGKVVSDLVVLP